MSDDAVESAARAFPEWAATPMHERSAVLVRASAIIDDAAVTWGRELAAEEGKTVPEGIAEVRRAAQIFRYAAGDADRDAGELYHSPRRGERILITRRPLGVIGGAFPLSEDIVNTGS